ncbi:MAG: hypothetical protein ACKVW3_10945 [Phycisphaerales bacterium]
MTTVEIAVRIKRGAGGRLELRTGAEPTPPPPPSRVPRVARLAALALRIENLVREGRIRDHAEAARLGGVTRARMAQVMGLTNLAPDILEAVLFLTAPQTGRDPITERDLRPIVVLEDWDEQRAAWEILVRLCGGHTPPKSRTELVGQPIPVGTPGPESRNRPAVRVSAHPFRSASAPR